MQSHGNLIVLTDAEAGAAGRNDHQVHRRPQRGDIDLIEVVNFAVELHQQRACGAHLHTAGTLAEVGHVGAPVRRRDRDEALHPLEAAEALEVVAADDPAHAEAHQVEALAGGKGPVNEGSELLSEVFERAIAIAGGQIEAVYSPPLARQVAREPIKHPSCVIEAVHQNHWIAIADGVHNKN